MSIYEVSYAIAVIAYRNTDALERRHASEDNAADIEKNYYCTDYNGGRTLYAEFPYGEKTCYVYITNGVPGGDEKVDLTGAEVYLDSLGLTPSGSSYQLKEFETLIFTK